MGSSAIVGTTIRYIAGRNAIQTVYWRTTTNEVPQNKMLKVSKTLNIGNMEKKAPSQVQGRISHSVRL